MAPLKRSMIALVFTATLALAASAVTAGEPARAKFWVENDSIDLGTVVAGETASATFIFHNDGDTEVNIIRAAPS